MLTRRTLLGLLSATTLLAVVPAAGAVERRPFDRAAFDAAVAAGGPVLVDVNAPWCSTCRAQGKVLGKLFKSRGYKGYQVFVVDYDSEKDVMRSFGATQRSTLIVFSGGSERGRLVGDTRAGSIEALLAKGL
ncbi:MAG: thioredoxin family protein [Bauldia sp.]|nr:thioredoxin family protein [Bauldia sp.]